MKRFAAAIVRPSFLEGMARIVDIGGTLQDEFIVSHGRQKKGVGQAKVSTSQRLTSSQVDAKALASDWDRISHDMKVSAKRLAGKYLERISSSSAHQTRVKTHR